MEVLTDDSYLPFKTKYSHLKMKEVPPEFLFKLYEGAKKGGGMRKILQAYIEENLQKLIIRQNEGPKPICNKFAYINKKLANEHLRAIKDHTGSKDKKIPIRSYECSNCSQWHLTSQTKEEYDNNPY